MNARPFWSRLVLSSSLTFLAVALLATTAYAQMEDVVVSARRLGEERLQDIPATISAIDESVLRDQQITDFDNFARFIPGLSFDDQSPGQRRYVIRGVRSAGQQQVGVYYDDVPLPGVQSSSSDSGSQTPDLKLYDMERVEVLRGPQGTTFGANSQSGTVRFITKKPVMEEFEAYGMVNFSNTEDADGNNYSFFGVLNMPFSKTFAGRLLVYDGEDAGYINNRRCRPIDPTQPIGIDNQTCLNLDGLNSVETTGARANLRWQPSDKLTIDGQFWWQDRELNGDNRYHPFDTYGQRGGDPNGSKDNVAAFTFFETGEFLVGDYAQTFKPDEQFIAAATINWETDWGFDVTFAPSFYNRDFEFKFDSTWIITFLDPMVTRPDLTFALTDQRQELDQSTVELRFTSNDADAAFRWVGGVFWRKRESEFQSFVPTINEDGLTFDPGTPFTIPPTSNPGAGIPGCHPCVFARFANKDIEETAVFADATFTFAENFELGAGIRWFETDFGEVGQTVFNFALFSPNPPTGGPELLSDNDSETPWRLSLGWSPTDDITTYILRSNGFRLGGSNNPGIINDPSNPGIPPLFAADELINYEWGLKTQWLEQALTWNLYVFLQTFENIQVPAQDPTGAFNFIGNAGEAEINGFETELFASPTENWDLTANLTYLWKKELTEDQVSDSVVAPGRSGDELPRIPELTFAFTAQYNYPLPLADWDGFVRVEGTYTDKSETELSPTSPNNRFQDDYSIFNARLGFNHDPWDLTVRVFVENLTNEDGDVFIGVGNGQPTFKYTNRPRTFGVEVSKGFGRN
ncbi:MAG: TonB-dependent receptor [Gammaproteobacteria bacterium]|nr:TonB-dependent receptor [Gammaproteobacteria bacterium]